MEPEHVKVWFAAEIAPFIREESRHASQKLTENSDGSLFFEVDVAEPEEVLWWALRWGGNFEIIEPQWLRDEAIKTIRKMAQRYIRENDRGSMCIRPIVLRETQLLEGQKCSGFIVPSHWLFLDVRVQKYLGILAGLTIGGFGMLQG